MAKEEAIEMEGTVSEVLPNTTFRVLLENGASVHERSTAGFLPLLFAAQQGNLAIARDLVAHGADVDATGGDGSTALLVAIDSGVLGLFDPDEAAGRDHAAVVRFLIEKGADVATVRRIYALQLLSLDRYFMSRGYSFLVRHLLGVSLRDTETGFKFFRRATVLPLLDEIEDGGWFWDTEFMVRAARRGLRVVEIPGAYLRREDKTSTVRGLRDSLRYFLALLRFRRRLRSERP